MEKNGNRNVNRLGIGMDEGGDEKGNGEGDMDRVESSVLDFTGTTYSHH